MKFSAAVALQLLVVFQSVFFAIFLLVRRSRLDHPANASLAALLGLVAIHLGSLLLQEAGRIPSGLTPAQLSGLLYGPLFLTFIRSLTFRRRLRPADGGHLVPGLPARRLSSLVNRGRSQTFSDWVNGYRIEEAKRLLGGGAAASHAILDILYEAGFNSKSTFNAVFKEKTGLTPGEYRRQARS